MLDRVEGIPVRTAKKPELPANLKAALEERCVTLKIPRSEEGYWTLLRYLDGRGGFTIGDATRRLPEDARTDLAGYVGLLLKAGYLAASNAGSGFLRITRPQPEAPRLTRSGKQRVVSTRQSYLWRGMKMLGFFTIADLVHATSGPDLAISSEHAERYVDELAAAGYLLSRAERGRTVYRLKPQMNTGPAAPQALRARFVWDPNLCRVMGDATRIEDVRS